MTSTGAAPLRNASILRSVLGFVGAGNALFSIVSKSYKEIYDSVDEHHTVGIVNDLPIGMASECYETRRITCAPSMTLSSAVFSSASCLQLAVAAGFELNAEDNWRVQHFAGRYSDLQTLHAARQLGLKLSEHTLKGAAHAGSIHKLIHLLGAGGTFTARTCSAAAKGGHIATLKWLRAQGCEWDNAEICGDAAESGDMNTLLYTREQGGVVNANTMSAAAQAGSLHICQYLHTQQCPMDADATHYSAYAGHADVLGWLLQRGCPVDLERDGLLYVAATGGHTQVLQCLLDASLLQTPQQKADMLKWAASRSNLAAAQWLRQHGAAWPAVLCNEDGEEWPDDAVAWARSQGCTASTDCFDEGDY
jgi:hypothetical protein